MFCYKEISGSSAYFDSLSYIIIGSESEYNFYEGQFGPTYHSENVTTLIKSQGLGACSADNIYYSTPAHKYLLPITGDGRRWKASYHSL